MMTATEALLQTVHHKHQQPCSEKNIPRDNVSKTEKPNLQILGFADIIEGISCQVCIKKHCEKITNENKHLDYPKQRIQLRVNAPNERCNHETHIHTVAVIEQVQESD